MNYPNGLIVIEKVSYEDYDELDALANDNEDLERILKTPMRMIPAFDYVAEDNEKDDCLLGFIENEVDEPGVFTVRVSGDIVAIVVLKRYSNGKIHGIQVYPILCEADESRLYGIIPEILKALLADDATAEWSAHPEDKANDGYAEFVLKKVNCKIEKDKDIVEYSF